METTSSTYTLDGAMVSLLQKTIVGKSVELEDLERWFSQGFCFAEDEPCYGLTQSHGGPCGVISALQAEIFREVLFGDERGSKDDQEALPVLSRSKCQDIFEKAAWKILRRLSTDGVVHLMDPGSHTFTKFADCAQLNVLRCPNEETFQHHLRALMSVYMGEAGCFLYLLSVVVTRGAQCIREEMDDLETTLIGNFGHCTQELMNLLLVGQATSNVFDGSMPLSGSGASGNASDDLKKEGGGEESKEDSMMLRGIPHRSTIGYLTQLEALRYCQVGSFYKIPQFPIWVVGSTSHFTVLFSMDRRINEESADEALLTRVQRAFKSIDSDECGFLMEDRLPEVLNMLDIRHAEDTNWLLRLSNHLQMEGGGGIILWSNFWETISMLLTGHSLDDITSPCASDVTRSLQLEEEKYECNSRERSDSDLARQLQAEWNATDVDTDTEVHVRTGTDTSELNKETSPTKKMTRHRTDSVADQDAEVFILYHYNGFAGGYNNSVSKSSNTPSSISHRKLTRLTLFRRSEESAVGQSIAFSGGGGSAYSGNSMSPVEEVLRTRWPGCRLEWLGSEPRLN